MPKQEKDTLWFFRPDSLNSGEKKTFFIVITKFRNLASKAVFFCRNHDVLFFFYRVETIDGSAVEEEDYKPVNEVLTFEPNERMKEVKRKTSFFPQEIN